MAQPLLREDSVSANRLRGIFPFFRLGAREDITEPRLAQPVNETGPRLQTSIMIPHRRFPTDLFNDLTKNEMQFVLEILHYTMEATTVPDLHQLLQLIQRVTACPRVIGGVAELNYEGRFQQFNSVINVSYSTDWLYTYCKRNYADIDPVLQSVLSTFQTQVWEQTYKATSLPKQLEFVEEARSYGLTHGLTTGMLESGRSFASFFSFAGGEFDNTVRYTGLLEYLLPYLHRIMMSNVHTPSGIHMKRLSHRELTVLEWMKQGKTNWEISRIIGVSERTVRFHAESIFTKLDVGSRTQAVACAIEHGLLPNT